MIANMGGIDIGRSRSKKRLEVAVGTGIKVGVGVLKNLVVYGLGEQVA